MIVKKLDYDTDYKTVCHWWESHSWPIIPRASLTDNGVFITDDEGRGICAGWLFSPDCNIAWIEYIVKNPEASHEDSDQGLDLLIKTLVRKASTLGFGMIFTSVSSVPLMERYAKLGFIKGDQNVTQFILPLERSH